MPLKAIESIHSSEENFFLHYWHNLETIVSFIFQAISILCLCSLLNEIISLSQLGTFNRFLIIFIRTVLWEKFFLHNFSLDFVKFLTLPNQIFKKVFSGIARKFSSTPYIHYLLGSSVFSSIKRFLIHTAWCQDAL